MRAGGGVVAVDFTLNGQPFVALNGRRDHWNALVEGGAASQCGWLQDRCGVSWQVVPNELATLPGDPDPARAGRALQAMLGMRKLDIDTLRMAADGAGAA
jgi:predicted 3-demethylubiquinone-9 3-methyltransferase (glyoxalase superfamily)